MFKTINALSRNMPQERDNVTVDSNPNNFVRTIFQNTTDGVPGVPACYVWVTAGTKLRCALYQFRAKHQHHGPALFLLPPSLAALIGAANELL